MIKLSERFAFAMVKIVLCVHKKSKSKISSTSATRKNFSENPSVSYLSRWPEFHVARIHSLLRNPRFRTAAAAVVRAAGGGRHEAAGRVVECGRPRRRQGRRRGAGGVRRRLRASV